MDVHLMLAQAAAPETADPGTADAASTTTAAEGAEGAVEGATAATDAAADTLPSAEMILERLDFLHQPMPALEHLASLSLLWPTMLAVLGLLCILNGYRWHKPVVALLGFIIGIGVGNDLAGDVGRPMVIGLAVGLLLAIIAAPLLRLSVALLAGCTGGFMGANIWTGLIGTVDVVQPEQEWIGATIGFVILAMLSFMMFRFCVVLATSVGGAFMLVFGVIALLMQIEDLGTSVATTVDGTRLLMPILTLLSAVGGFVVQYSRLKEEGVTVFGVDAEQT